MMRFPYLSSVRRSECIHNNMDHYRESYKRSKMRSSSQRLQIMPLPGRQSRLWSTLHPWQCVCLPRTKTHLQYVVMTYMTQPTHISPTRLGYEHASKSFSSLLLIWIYLFHWQWWDGWRNCLQWLLSAPSVWRGRWWWRLFFFSARQTAPDGRIYSPRAQSPAQNIALSLGRSFSLSLLYWSRSSQVHNFRVSGASPDRREI